jgi:hypothetical protein
MTHHHKKLTKDELDKVQTLVAKYTGFEADAVLDWEYPDTPRAALIAEGEHDEWAIIAAGNDELNNELHELGVWIEPYSHWALSVFRR